VRVISELAEAIRRAQLDDDFLTPEEQLICDQVRWSYAYGAQLCREPPPRVTCVYCGQELDDTDKNWSFNHAVVDQHAWGRCRPAYV